MVQKDHKDFKFDHFHARLPSHLSESGLDRKFKRKESCSWMAWQKNHHEISQ